MIRRLLPYSGGVETAEDLEDAYVHPEPHHLRVNFVTSLDGAVEIEGRSGPLGGPADRQAFMAMRAVADVVLVGAGTAEAEDYGPVKLAADVQGRRAQRGQAAVPRLAVVTARGRLDRDARMFSGGEPVIILTTEALAGSRPDLADVAEMVACGTDHVDLVTAVSELHQRGLGRVLCEGGPTLTRSLFDADQVDELCVTFSPVMAGEGRYRLAHAWSGEPRRFTLSGLLEGDGMLMAAYARPAA